MKYILLIFGDISMQEFGLTPVMWQIVDLARWLDPRIRILTVVHSPRAMPNLEERGIVRAMSEMSDRLIVMSWCVNRFPKIAVA